MIRQISGTIEKEEEDQEEEEAMQEKQNRTKHATFYQDFSIWNEKLI